MSDRLKTISITPDQPGIRLDRLLQDHRLFLHAPCGGNHSCGKCKVRVWGELSAPSADELRFLSQEDLAEGVRLACFAQVFGPIQVALESTENNQILSDALTVHIADGALHGYGAAIDIGTTTVVCALYAADGSLVGTESRVNCQQSFGADVISRINQIANAGTEALHSAIVSQIEDMLSALCSRHGISRSALRQAVVTGNTTMLHFFAGLDATGIGLAPYTPQSLFDCTYDNILDGISVYIPPCISAYVGADTVCCLLFSDLTNKNENALLIDIGTNGEMALYMNGILTCCSTAAGPAFEGSGIAFGSIAKPGAVVSVSCDLEKQSFAFRTIDDQPAGSICGSGVIECLSAMRTLGLIDETGRIESEHPAFSHLLRRDDTLGLTFFFPGSSVGLTQQDVRQIQLAKAAIAGGSETLLTHCSSSAEKLDTLYLCGGFGSSLNCSAAEKIGLIPPDTTNKAVVLGNAALKGAAMLLLSNACREQIRTIASECRYIELSTDMTFVERYIDSMNFPEL